MAGSKITKELQRDRKGAAEGRSCVWQVSGKAMPIISGRGSGFSEIYLREAGNVETEISRFEEAVNQSEQQVLRVCHYVEAELSMDREMAIFQAYLMFLKDGGLKNKVIANIRGGHVAEYALKEVILNYLKTFARIEDPYIRQRGMDIENIGKRILRNLLGLGDGETGVFERDTILIASSLSPAELIRAQQEKLRGIILSKGGETSHVAILSRSFEIPMVINIPGLPEKGRGKRFPHHGRQLRSRLS